MKAAKIAQADSIWSTRSNGYHAFLKRQKVRIERRRAKRDPECVPGYGKYQGWES